MSEIIKDNAFSICISDFKSKDDVFNLYNKSLNFPEYFGNNWDALKDSLCYLNDWMDEKRILIIHKDLPHINDNDIKNYLFVLNDVCEMWEQHSDILDFQVYFPESCKNMIQEIFTNSNQTYI